MKYLLQIYNGGAMPELEHFSQEEQDAVVERYRVLSESPGVIGGAQLQPIDTATTVRVKDGEMLLSDGPFLDAKEYVGGFFLIEADGLDEALEIAARVPAAQMGGAIEVRPVVER